MNNLPEAAKNYLKNCQEQKRLDAKTLKAYQIDLTQFYNSFNINDIYDIPSVELEKYIADLRISAVQKHNEVDLVHCNFLIQIMKLLEHYDFLSSQSQKIREFYKYMAQEYPYLSFTFKGRIKS